jgi:hypothetical protein
MTADERQHLQDLLDAAELPDGPFDWRQCYEQLDGTVHWALCDPASTATGQVTDSTLVLLASWPTWSDDTPELWDRPLNTYPRLALIAALLTHARALIREEGQ